VLLDPNTLSDDGTVALRDASFSDDGSLLAYQVRARGWMDDVSLLHPWIDGSFGGGGNPIHSSP